MEETCHRGSARHRVWRLQGGVSEVVQRWMNGQAQAMLRPTAREKKTYVWRVFVMMRKRPSVSVRRRGVEEGQSQLIRVASIPPSSRMSRGSQGASGSNCRDGHDGCVHRLNGMQSSEAKKNGKDQRAGQLGDCRKRKTYTDTLLAALRSIAIEQRTHNLAALLHARAPGISSAAGNALCDGGGVF